MAPASVLGALRAQGRLRRALEGWRQLLEAGCDEATDSLSTMPSSCAAWTASIVSHAASEASAPGNALKGLRRRRCRSLTALCVSVLGSQAARVSKLRAPCGNNNLSRLQIHQLWWESVGSTHHVPAAPRSAHYAPLSLAHVSASSGKCSLPPKAVCHLAGTAAAAHIPL